MPSILTQNTDYLGDARGRLTQLFRDKPRIDGLLQAFMAECQELEDDLYTWLIAALLQSESVAYDDLLDKFGKWVGQQRKGFANTQYRLFILARILTNKSDGKRETMISIGKALMPDQDIIVTEYIGAVQIEALDAMAIPASIVAKDFLIPAVVAGVRLFFVWSGYAEEETFTLGWTGASYGVDAQGLGWTGDADIGGHLTGQFAGSEHS